MPPPSADTAAAFACSGGSYPRSPSERSTRRTGPGRLVSAFIIATGLPARLAQLDVKPGKVRLGSGSEEDLPAGVRSTRVEPEELVRLPPGDVKQSGLAEVPCDRVGKVYPNQVDDRQARILEGLRDPGQQSGDGVVGNSLEQLAAGAEGLRDGCRIVDQRGIGKVPEFSTRRSQLAQLR